MIISSLNFLTLNVGTSSSLAGAATLIEVEKIDIVFLQEVRLSSEQIELSLRGFKTVANIDDEDPSRPGIALAWRHFLPVSNVVNLVSCRLQIATLGSIKLMNLYAPSGSAKKHDRYLFFSNHVFQTLILDNITSWIWAGDFNCVLKAIDIEDGRGFDSKKCPVLADITSAGSLFDPFRFLHPHKKEFTFFRPGCAASRLDRFYLSRDLESDVCSVSHHPSLSDHCAAKLVLSWLSNTSYNAVPPISYWKLNTLILKEDTFMASFRPFWKHLLSSQNDFLDVSDWWDLRAKPEIKNFCIGYSVQRKTARNQTKRFLLASLHQALTVKDWEEVARYREELTSMLNFGCHGACGQKSLSAECRGGESISLSCSKGEE